MFESLGLYISQTLPERWGFTRGIISDMAKAELHELRHENEWDQAWKNVRGPKTLNTSSLFGFCLDKLMKKHLRNGMKLLEIGCAGGKYLIYFNQNFDCDICGVDYSAVGCKLAQRNLELTKTPGTIICDDIFKCEKLEKESFDSVFSQGFIEHFDQTEKVIAKHIDFLKPGGKLIIGLPNMLDFTASYLECLTANYFININS